MAALDFPSSPTDGQVYNNWIYSSAKGAWKSKPLTAAKTVNSDTPPSNPANGDQWFNTIDSTLYIYYTDADTSQWVESRAPIISDGYYSPNYIINGAFDIAQRGTSFPAAASGTYPADRWLAYWDGSGATRNLSLQAFTPGSAPVAGYEATQFYRMAQTVAGTGGTYNVLVQRIEDVRTLAGQTATISFWAKADASRTISVNFDRNYGTGGSTIEYAQSGSSFTVGTAWQRFSSTVSIASLAGKTIGANSYLSLNFAFSNNTVQTIDIWGVQLESGSVATPFRRNANSLQGELAACQRYYYRMQLEGSYARYGVGRCDGTTSVLINILLPVTMRAIPSNTNESSAAATFYLAGPTSVTCNTIFTLSATQFSTKQVGIYIGNSGGGLTTNSFYELFANATANTYFAWSAEL